MRKKNYKIHQVIKIEKYCKVLYNNIMENQKRNKPTVSATLTPEVIEMLNELTKETGTNKSSVISMAITKYYKDFKKK